jgi:hypothetical protein
MPDRFCGVLGGSFAHSICRVYWYQFRFRPILAILQSIAEERTYSNELQARNEKHTTLLRSRAMDRLAAQIWGHAKVHYRKDLTTPAGAI